jgi:hypothetical protein
MLINFVIKKNLAMETVINQIDQEFKDFIITQNHPCIMANTVFQMDNYQLKRYDNIESDAVVKPILADIENYLEHYDFESNQFESLIMCFTQNEFQTEMEFEKALWNLLQKLHNKDDAPWDSNVSNNPEDINFSFSLKGKAFYVIGMHPQSSRLARQAPYCTVVFNLHWQFEKLREMGTYQKVKNRIRTRDAALQGFINPTLKDFGQDSESRQYSGRKIDDSWKCPFHHKN